MIAMLSISVVSSHVPICLMAYNYNKKKNYYSAYLSWGVDSEKISKTFSCQHSRSDKPSNNCLTFIN